MSERINKTLEFVKKVFDEGEYFKTNEAHKNYRFEHSIRVANIGKIVAEKEGFNVENLVIACLLHDLSYGKDELVGDDWSNHGRVSAKLARPFLEDLNLSKDVIDEMCFGIAIHVDGKADFNGCETAFAASVSDADNIDRFDTYRIYENLVFANFNEIKLDKKFEYIDKKLEELNELKKIDLATETATSMFHEKVEFQIEFFIKLKKQLECSTSIDL